MFYGYFGTNGYYRCYCNYCYLDYCSTKGIVKKIFVKRIGFFENNSKKLSTGPFNNSHVYSCQMCYFVNLKWVVLKLSNVFWMEEGMDKIFSKDCR
jgi:hypothetical protein